MKILQKYLEESNRQDTDDSTKCIIVNNNNILLLRRGEGGGEGMWDLPGGHIHEGEEPEDGLKREVYEETGIKIKNIKHVTDFNFKMPEVGIDSLVKVYKAKPDGPGNDIYLNPTMGNPDKFEWQKFPRPEHTEYKWVIYKDELDRLPMIEELKKIVRKHLKSRTS